MLFTNALQTNRQTNEHSLLQRCEDASKKNETRPGGPIKCDDTNALPANQPTNRQTQPVIEVLYRTLEKLKERKTNTKGKISFREA